MTCARCGKVIHRTAVGADTYTHATGRERCADGRGHAHPTNPDHRPSPSP